MGRSISFAEDDSLCVYHDGAVMDCVDVDAHDIWYQCSDMLLIKRKALQLTKESPASSHYSLCAALNNTYGRDDPGTLYAIKAWCMGCSSRRGLERFLNRDYCCRRSDLRRRVVTSVLRAQGKMREEGIDDQEYISNVISRLSETFSNDAKLFAQALGAGDEFASGHNNRRTTCEDDPMEIDNDDLRKKLGRNDSPASVMDLFPGVQLPPSTISSRHSFTDRPRSNDLGWRTFA